MTTPATAAVDLSTSIGSFHLPAPTMTASGCAAAGAELAPYLDLASLGAVVTKSVLRDPRSGRATPRMAETPSGMLNSIGLQGPGIDAFLEHDLPVLADAGARVVVSIAGGDPEEFGELAGRLAALGPDSPVGAVEVNISCPNVANRGLVFACDPGASRAVLEAASGAVRASQRPDLPVLAKLSPDVTDLVAVALACTEGGASGLTAINTTLGMVVDPVTLRPQLAGVTGGTSGPAIRPIAVRCIWQLTAAKRAGVLPDVPVVGAGGVASGADALQLIAVGACAVQVGTATFADPSAPARVARELEAELARRGVARLADVVGIAHEPGRGTTRSTT
ncbi:dihydroorotate dehydrogenase [Streptomyces sp. NP160]|uniref:dihydroorotate dehydrogenase n=1 Tax=Streptomyces sp. NP160 TaxID=2586637 RepID=UPI00111A9524|nr:dihydroorotate dehydrogenase [Streptomyces sp. NP160]TNM64514.1 dihydroorotate dehydrogenase [Streptomyces sp. NP160]